MKKLVQQVLVLGLLGAWALIAISSAQSPSSKCNEEWKIVFDNHSNAKAHNVREGNTASHTEMYYPGLRSLILQ